jgi:amino acid permease
LGTGILTLPKAFSQTGIVLGALVTIGAAMLNYWIMMMLTRSCQATGSRTFEEIGVSLFSSKAKTVIDSVQMFVLFGITTCLFIVCGDSLGGVLSVAHQFSDSTAAARLSDLCARDAGGDYPFGCRVAATGVPAALVVLPLGLLKDTSSLRFASTLSVSSVLFVLLVVTARGIQGVQGAGGSAAFGRRGLLVPLTWSPIGILGSIPVIVMSFGCQFNVPPIFSELREKSVPRMSSILRNASAIWCGVYIGMGAFGCCAFPDGLPSSAGDILTAFPAADRLIFVCRIAMFVVVCCTVPLVLLPLRSAVTFLALSKFPEHAQELSFSRLWHVSQTVLLVLCAFGLSVVFPDLTFVVGLVGSTGGVFLLYIAPTAFWIKCLREKGEDIGHSLYIPIGTGVAICVVSTASILYEKFG